ncbi:unnamed protein product [Bursaphelenchus xylophilus]|uniref:(pine wood nematode) hypothetical protein n=1 Tax=Bursaphelenchus xylophilus TaxID=6326 RepID=A0A1I7RIQ2_BURXY|nr:unnamed protein product [Bursaphelenchus xylophilus]CAG9119006.1 unnamed protein product [Bursaphelenchus xylophilus]
MVGLKESDGSGKALDNEIGTSTYTFDYVRLKLLKNSEEFRQLNQKNKISEASYKIIGAGDGIVSSLYKVTFAFDDDAQFSVVLKVPTNAVINFEDTNVPHECECKLFDLIKDLKDLPVPTCYYTELGGEKHPGCIIMQDLSESCTGISIKRYVTEELCFEIAKVLAKFQASIGTLDEKKWKGVFKNDLFAREFYGRCYQTYLGDTAVKCGLKADLMKKCMCLTNSDFSKFATKGIAEKHDVVTLCHGDVHSNNILFYKNEDNSVSNRIAALIDWQAVFDGNPLSDLARFMVCCPQGNVRRACEARVLATYYETVCDEFTKKGFRIPFSSELCQTLYEYAFLQQVPSAMIHPQLLYDVELEGVEEKVKSATRDILSLKANHAMEDALPLIKKYDLERKYQVDKASKSLDSTSA